jgi:hypothetical protein
MIRVVRGREGAEEDPEERQRHPPGMLKTPCPSWTTPGRKVPREKKK